MLTLTQNPSSTTKAVVSNDTQITSQNAISTEPSKPKTLDEMEAARKRWQTTAFRTSNQQLYGVLADCLAYGAELEVGAAKARSKELQEFLESRNYIVKKDSPLMTRIVKSVFGAVDRRRVSTYSLVLREAQKQGVQPSKLADWIEERGGIQEVRLSKSATYVSPKSKAEMARDKLAAMPNLAVVKSAELTLQADADFVGEECLLLAEQQADGSFCVKHIVRNNAALTAALTSLYSAQAAV
jgi:hypothetical protein